MLCEAKPTSEQLLQARKDNVCRICKKEIVLFLSDPTYPQEFHKFYGNVVEQRRGYRIVLNFGEEYAHDECLTDHSQDVSA